MSLFEFETMDEFLQFGKVFKGTEFGKTYEFRLHNLFISHKLLPFTVFFIYSLAEFELYFWIGGNALSYMSDVNGRDVPADKWRWVGSGRQIDLPKEAWGENQPNRGFHDDTKCYEACIALDGESTDIHDLHCNQRFPVICQKIEYN
jgi:hypothetical protein